MKAAVLREFKEPLAIEDVIQPKPAAQEVLIEVEACGVCHSDLHLADGDWPQLVPITKRPLILGHEIAGRVVEKGASVNQLEVGDRVGCTGPAANARSAGRAMRISVSNNKLPA
jgi:propanol-preferring alcohol dehydrogenase